MRLVLFGFDHLRFDAWSQKLAVWIVLSISASLVIHREGFTANAMIDGSKAIGVKYYYKNYWASKTTMSRVVLNVNIYTA